MARFRHAGLEELVPYLIREHPDAVPTEVGNHLKYWIPVFTGNPGFRLEFTPMKIGAGMTTFLETINLQGDFHLMGWDRRGRKVRG